MNVTELIDYTNTLAADDEITVKERGLYLKYLNLANLDLYRIAASGLNTIVRDADIFLNDDTQSFAVPDEIFSDLFRIRQVFINTVSLTKADVNAAKDIKPDTYLLKNREIFCNLKSNSASFPLKVDEADGNTKKYISVLYAPNPLKLVETVLDASTETDTPVYPVPYHHFLAHGALYYMYFSNKVFWEKIAFIKNIWEESKAELGQFKNYGL